MTALPSPAMDMATRMLVELEDIRLQAYQDVAGIWTIGVGCIRMDGRAVKRGDSCTKDQALAMCNTELAPVERLVDQTVHVPLAVHEKAALMSFTYNVGPAAFRNSTLVRLLNAGDRAGAANEFAKWVYAAGRVVRGLVIRRAEERDVFLGKTTY